jgi:flagellar M-ring protein FliF
MIWTDYWGAISRRQQLGMIFGAALIGLVTAGLGFWLLHDPYVPLARGLDSQHVNGLAQELERGKLSYRIASGGDGIDVPQSQLGKASAAAAGGPNALPPSVGLELFKETDFSSTDFAQRINYQRALQGELTRTIQGMAGVRTARVHIILAEGGLFKRDATKAGAAVSLTMLPDKRLGNAQVRGIQRLVAASVPDIRVDDVVVLDEGGGSIARSTSDFEGEVPAAQFDVKRQVDQYLESKVLRLLESIVPQGSVSSSVDTVLDLKQRRVTTDEPLGAKASKDAEMAAGVLVKERQSQRGHVAGSATASDASGVIDNVEWEHEYKVGNRIEQVSSMPGSIVRVTVAVVLRDAPESITSAAVEQLVAHAIGMDRARGDSVDVLVVRPSLSPKSAYPLERDLPAAVSAPAAASALNSTQISVDQVAWWVGVIAPLLAGILAWLVLRWRKRRRPELAAARDDIEASLSKVRQWLQEGASNGRL